LRESIAVAQTLFPRKKGMEVLGNVGGITFYILEKGKNLAAMIFLETGWEGLVEMSPQRMKLVFSFLLPTVRSTPPPRLHRKRSRAPDFFTPNLKKARKVPLLLHPACLYKGMTGGMGMVALSSVRRCCVLIMTAITGKVEGFSFNRSWGDDGFKPGTRRHACHRAMAPYSLPPPPAGEARAHCH